MTVDEIKDRFYSAEDMIKIARNGGIINPKGRCSCGIHETKPQFCKMGPIPETLMPGCGFSFENENGQLVRKGECKRTGMCCALPRKNGDPWGCYDPAGKVCKHLIVEDADVALN